MDRAGPIHDLRCAGAPPLGAAFFRARGRAAITGRRAFWIFLVSLADSWERGRNRERSRAARGVPRAKGITHFSFYVTTPHLAVYHVTKKTAERLEEKSGGLLVAVVVTGHEGLDYIHDFLLLVARQSGNSLEDAAGFVHPKQRLKFLRREFRAIAPMGSSETTLAIANSTDNQKMSRS